MVPERFATIFNTQLNGIVIIDPETHTIVDANIAAVQMIGASREDVSGHICHKFICPAEKGRCPITDLGIDVDNRERVLTRTDHTKLSMGIDGLETYRRVLEINPKQRAIMVSGFSETDRVRKAQQLGAGAYVKKPYVMEKIGMAIRDELPKVSSGPA